MKFGRTPLQQAHGAFVAHTHHLPGLTLRKGTRLGEVELAALAAAEHVDVVAARLEPGDLDEDQAAARVAQAVTGSGVHIGKARTGRSNLHAVAHGLLLVDAHRVDSLNLVDPAITLGTLLPATPVHAGEMVATVKIIPYGVPAFTVEAACAVGEVLRVAPFVRQRVGFVASTLPGASEKVRRTTIEAQRRRVEALGSDVLGPIEVPHEPEATAAALRELLDEGVDLVLFIGASAIVDLEDVLPSAIRAVGGTVLHLGMPVDPGNLTLLGRRGEVMIVGVPGCARSPKRSGFDQVLERLLARVPTVGSDLQRMGVGGLLMEIAERGLPRAQSKPRSRFGAVVLAAGLSSRMKTEHKLLADLDGRPLVTYAVDALAQAGVAPVVVVTGHVHDGIAAALGDRPVTLVRNPQPEAGMSSSLALGLAALDPTLDGFFVMLGDIPFVRPEDVRALVSAFDADAAPICVPVQERRRGHPVLWGRRFRDSLLRLEGDVGARAILDAHPESVRLVEVDNPGIHLDVDTPEALALARRYREPKLGGEP